jgi:hypothetical protein
LVVVLVGVLVGSPSAQAQSEKFRAQDVNAIDTHYALVITRTGNRLTFDISGSGGSSGLEGTPICEVTELKADGSFSTYCRHFNTVSSPTRLSGTLALARLDPVIHMGGATFKLVAAP